MIEVVQPEDGLKEFVELPNEIYGHKGPRLPSSVEEARALFSRRTPFAEGREYHVLVARERGRVVARAVAVMDERYFRRWNERIGHVIMFEALPAFGDSARAVLDAACDWLRDKGAVAARAGLAGRRSVS